MLITQFAFSECLACSPCVSLRVDVSLLQLETFWSRHSLVQGDQVLRDQPPKGMDRMPMSYCLFRPSSSIGVREELGSTVLILCLIAHSGLVVGTLAPRKYATMILSLYASNYQKMLLVRIRSCLHHSIADAKFLNILKGFHFIHMT